jgi:hypothetical protein
MNPPESRQELPGHGSFCRGGVVAACKKQLIYIGFSDGTLVAT